MTRARIALIGMVAGLVLLVAGLACRPGSGREPVATAVGAGAPAASPAPAAGAQRYHCPMHPGYISDSPGDCPICGMRLVPIVEHGADHGGSPAGGMAPAMGSGRPVEGYASVSIPIHRQQLIGVKTGVVERRSLESSVETVGDVTYDETGLSWVNTRVAGWIEVLHVDRTGQAVRRGQPLLEIYSPELVATQEEYLIARDNLDRLRSTGAGPQAIEGAQGLLDDARLRLDRWNIPAAAIDRLDEAGAATRRVSLKAPSDGYVVEKTALAGAYVTAGENLLRIADLSRVWVLARVYDYQLPLVRAGQQATVTLSYLPGRRFSGRVDYVYPYLDKASRTVDVRIVVPNPDGVLRPEMYASVRIEGPSDDPVLLVPREAILDTGERSIAFVSLGDGIFEPREVSVGRRTADRVEVLDGLAEGESVVTSGNFLIDSESRIKAALSGMGGGSMGHTHGQ